MAVAVRRTQFTNQRAQSAALHGKTRPYHVHARAMAEERVDRESGAEEIVARESFNEEGSVEDIFCAHPMSLLQPEMQRMKQRNHESVTATMSCVLTKTRCVTGRMTIMQSKSLRKSGMRLCRDLGLHQKQRQDHTILVFRIDIYTAIRLFGG
jgi:hypothetical protein